MATNALQVFVLHDGQLLTSEVFGEGVYVVGSDPGSDLVLDDSLIAPQHLSLQFRAGQVLLKDHGSPLGTFVNGRPATETAVTSADDIHIGPYLLKLRQLAKKKPTTSPPPSGLAGPVAGSNVVPIGSATPLGHPAPRYAGGSTQAALARAVAQTQTAPAATSPATVIPLHPERAAPPEFDVDELLTALDESHTAPASDEGEWPALEEESSADSGAARDAPPAVASVPGMVPAPPLRPPSPPIQRAPVPPPKPPAPIAVQPAPAPPSRPTATAVVQPGPAPVARPASKPAPKPEASRPGEHLRVSVSWGNHPVTIRSFRPGQPVTAAPSETAPLPLYGFPFDQPTDLARPGPSGWTLSVPAGADVAFVGLGGRLEPLAPLSGSVPLPLNRAVRLTLGHVRVDFLRQVPPALPGLMARPRDWAFFGMILVLAIGAAIFVHFAPDPPKVRPQQEVQKVKDYVLAMMERKPPPKKVEPLPRHEVQRAPPPKPLAEAQTLKAATDALKPVDKVASATKEIDNVVSALNKLNPLKAGAGAKNALAGLGDLPKIPTMGPLGGGTGGGIGDLNSLGGPLTAGASALRGAGKLGSGTAGAGRVRGVPISVPKKPQQVQGQIDRDALARVINEHVNEMRNCYERALLRDPNVGAGKVTLEWTIGAAGSVTDVGTKTSTLKNAEVVSCLLDVVRRLQFPKPQGGVVIVSYPILFNSVGY